LIFKGNVSKYKLKDANYLQKEKLLLEEISNSYNDLLKGINISNNTEKIDSIKKNIMIMQRIDEKLL